MTDIDELMNYNEEWMQNKINLRNQNTKIDLYQRIVIIVSILFRFVTI